MQTYMVHMLNSERKIIMGNASRSNIVMKHNLFGLDCSPVMTPLDSE